MSHTQLAYLVFGIVIVLALVFDLGLLAKKGKAISMQTALKQTLFWVSLSLGFFAFLWWDEGSVIAVKYLTAYLMEWSLSIDNIFVFILIFSFFKIGEMESGRALLIGILLAIIFRILFIALGIELINRFHWLLYVFGAFLVYTGIKLFSKKEEEEYNPGQTKLYKWFTGFFRILEGEPRGRYIVKYRGKVFFTKLSLVVLMLAATDIVFALDSIPTVVSLVRDDPKIPFTPAEVMVIYSSNIFAVLGLRSLFFLLKGAVNKFDYLQQGIAVVLIFIGVKMLIEYFHIKIPIQISLGFIVLCLGGSILYSLQHSRKGVPPEDKGEELDAGS
ncbi:MAG TPA: TerC/Alx family metal homeostasis membrane protein [Phnomibacter sp.]|nr:TerC/Alx family metal homeostasis membrane protein [Phnomibacter sp.]